MQRLPRLPATTSEGQLRWNSDRSRQAYQLALLGATIDQMAGVMGVSVTTILRWETTHSEFRDDLERGRTAADGQVVESFFRTCTGFTYEEDVVTTYQGRVRVTRVARYMPPNAAACQRWLSVRQRALWGDVARLDINQQITVTKLDLTDLSDSDLETLERIGMQRLTATPNATRN